MRLREPVKLLLLVILAVVMAWIFYGALFSSFSTAPTTIGDAVYLDLVIAGEIEERTADDPVMDALGEAAPMSLERILQAIRRGARDERVKGLVLRPIVAATGWAKSDEIRRALLDFRAEGKPVYAYLEAAGDREYFLASAADTIIATPAGMLYMNGLLSQPLYFRETLAKVGVEADFIAIGKYKNAPETYTRADMSDDQREVLDAILDHYYQRFIATIAESRGLAGDSVDAIVDRAFFSTAAALKMGLVDTLAYYESWSDSLRGPGGDRARLVSIDRYLDSDPPPGGTVYDGGRLAVIHAGGTIVVGGAGANGRDGLVTSGGMAADIRAAADDDAVKAIILRIDSPGGSATASDIIWKEVVNAREKKPVVVSVSDLAASGGYYIAMAADTIVAHPTSLVGSIGIFAGKFVLDGLYDKLGVGIETLQRGRNADLFSETSRFSPEQRAIVGGFLEEFYEDFVTKAARGRRMSAADLEAVAQGRVWTGTAALELGLVDVLGDFSTAVRIAKEMAGIPEDQLVPLATYPRLRTVLERLLREGRLQMRGDGMARLPGWERLSPVMRSTVRALPYFRSGEPLYLHPVDFWTPQPRLSVPGAAGAWSLP